MGARSPRDELQISDEQLRLVALELLDRTRILSELGSRSKSEHGPLHDSQSFQTAMTAMHHSSDHTQLVTATLLLASCVVGFLALL